MSEQPYSGVPEVGIDAAWKWAGENGLLSPGSMNPSRPVEAAWLAIQEAGYVLLAPSDIEKLRGLERYVRTTAATPHHRLCNFLGGGECDCYRAGRNYLLADWALALIEGKQE